jgi:hypothetical protein
MVQIRYTLVTVFWKIVKLAVRDSSPLSAAPFGRIQHCFGSLLSDRLGELLLHPHDDVSAILPTFCRQTVYHPLAQGSTARYKPEFSRRQGDAKSYLAALGGTAAHAFRERHHKPLGHLSWLYST